MDNDAYDAELRELQIAMIRTQQLAIKEGWKVLVIFEGRDAAGKDGAIERVTGWWPRSVRPAASARWARAR